MSSTLSSSAAVVTISYHDLVQFKPIDHDDRNKRLMAQIGQAYGRQGLGILAVTDVPEFVAKRQRLLPLAAQLAHFMTTNDNNDQDTSNIVLKEA